LSVVLVLFPDITIIIIIIIIIIITSTLQLYPYRVWNRHNSSLLLQFSNESCCQVVNTLLRIREVPGSNLGTETGYQHVCHGLQQSLQANARTVS
jgi:hypothetical protein